MSSHKLILFALILVNSFVLSQANAAGREQPKLGHHMTAVPKPVTAPGFTLKDMDEVEHSLKDYSGKVVLINFWATWCPPCLREIPSLERLYQNYQDKDFAVLAVNQMETGDHVFAFTGQLDVDPSFTILFDRESKVSQSYRVNGLPTSFLVDKKGKIRFRAVGGREFDHPEVEKQINQLMAE